MLTLRKKILLVILLIFCMVMSFVSPLLTYRVYAETAAHTNVLDDLKRDPSFNANEFIRDDGDYELDLIQVAEGVSGELYVYVYNPAYKNKDLRAAKINMSLQDPSYSKIQYKLYDLTWLNSNGGFSKYVVNGVKATEEAYRYYTIATVYRAHNPDIDDPANDDDDIVNFEGMPVGQSWCLYFYNGRMKCESRKMEFVDVKINSVGFTRYYEKQDLPFQTLFPATEYIDSHFIAFSAENFDIKTVYDATLHFSKQSYFMLYHNFGGTAGWLPTDFTYSEPVEGLELDCSKDQDVVINQEHLFYNNTYTFSRIVDSATFINEITEKPNFFLSEEHENSLSQSQFVIRFFETDFTETFSGSDVIYSGTRISEVTILRLHFLNSDGKVYNLGVVADIVSDDGNPDAGVGTPSQVDWFKVAFVIIICLLVLNFIKDPSMALTKMILQGLWAIITLLFKILIAPFRLIAWFFT